MADYLASIYGTEKDKVNCSFYFKIGACRHGDSCIRKHIKPAFSQTLMLPNLYRNPEREENCTLSKDQIQQHVDNFYEDIFIELAKFGKIEEMRICDNIGEHLDGNVYVRFEYEEEAGNAVTNLNNRFYDGRPIWAELSPVTDFEEACCRQYDLGACNRGGVCNFMHLRKITPDLVRGLYKSQRKAILLKSEDNHESPSLGVRSSHYNRGSYSNKRSVSNYREDDFREKKHYSKSYTRENHANANRKV